MFVDLKAALDRSVLGKSMRRRRIREELVIRVEEVLRETRSKVRRRGCGRVFG